MNYKMKVNLKVIYSLVLIIGLTNCSYDNREELAKQEECNIEEVTFSGDIQPLLSQKCGACHGSSFPEAGIVLIGYEQVTKQIANGKLIGTITHTPGFSPMPKNSSKLSQCEIQSVQTWIDNGALNN
jgi:hypothetical protein